MLVPYSVHTHCMGIITQSKLFRLSPTPYGERHLRTAGKTSLSTICPLGGKRAYCYRADTQRYVRTTRLPLAAARAAAVTVRPGRVPMELRDYIRILRRRWKLIVGCVVLAVAAATALTMRATPEYTSTSRLFISTPSGASSDAYQGGLFSQQRVASYADLVTGQDLAQRVIDKLHLNESASALSSQVTSTVEPNTVLLDITVTDPVPAQAQQLAAAMATEFRKFVTELETAPGRSTSLIKATVVDAAGLATAPVSPKPVRNLGLAAILGLLLGFGLAVLRETLDTSVKSAQDIASTIGSAVLGTVRYDARAAKHPLVTDLDTHAARVEAFRVLRTNLQFVDVDRDSKVVVVTSALPEEGKSTTSINLAITLAQAGQRVLLMEGDLRRPKLPDYLHLEPTVGLTTVLIGKVAVEDAIQPWGDDGLHVITSGSTPPNPAELLQSRAMEAVLEKARADYDVVIVDAPPLLPVTDGALLSAQGDGALLVVRCNKTTKDQLAEARDRLASVDARVLGCLLNMAPERGTGGYGYGYGYGYAPLTSGGSHSRKVRPSPSM